MKFAKRVFFAVPVMFSMSVLFFLNLPFTLITIPAWRWGGVDTKLKVTAFSTFSFLVWEKVVLWTASPELAAELNKEFGLRRLELQAVKRQLTYRKVTGM